MTENPEHETVNRESHPNAGGPEGLAGDMGVSAASAPGPSRASRAPATPAATRTSVTDGESPTTPAPATAGGRREHRRRRPPDRRRGAARPGREQARVRPRARTPGTDARWHSGGHDRPVLGDPRRLRLPAAPRHPPRWPEEVLLQLRQGTGYRDGHWAAAAAGHVEKGESVYDAALREAAEEVGVTDVGLRPWCAMQRTGAGDDPIDERVDYIFLARAGAARRGSSSRPSARTCSGGRWTTCPRPSYPTRGGCWSRCGSAARRRSWSRASSRGRPTPGQAEQHAGRPRGRRGRGACLPGVAGAGATHRPDRRRRRPGGAARRR